MSKNKTKNQADAPQEVVKDAPKPEAKAPKEPKPMKIGAEVRKQYVKADERTASKGKVLHNNDVIAKAFAPLSAGGVEALQAVARENGTEVETRFAGYAHLNPGQQRMNLGNLLRGKYQRGEKIKVQGQTFYDEVAAKAHAEKLQEKATKQAEREAAKKAKADSVEPQSKS